MLSSQILPFFLSPLPRPPPPPPRRVVPGEWQPMGGLSPLSLPDIRGEEEGGGGRGGLVMMQRR